MSRRRMVEFLPKHIHLQKLAASHLLSAAAAVGSEQIEKKRRIELRDIKQCLPIMVG
jgi:hypothetical protein